jgi:hypothetical protein
MLFRDVNGNLIQLNRYDFKNDKVYYQKIMEIKKQFTKTTKNKYSNYSNYVINNTLKETFDHKNE